MKSIYISLPITGQEETYEARLNAAVAYVKAKYPEYMNIVTPKDIAQDVENDRKNTKLPPPVYKDYLMYDIIAISYCDAILLCEGWVLSKGCKAENAFALAIGIDILF